MSVSSAFSIYFDLCDQEQNTTLRYDTIGIFFPEHSLIQKYCSWKMFLLISKLSYFYEEIYIQLPELLKIHLIDVLSGP